MINMKAKFKSVCSCGVTINAGDEIGFIPKSRYRKAQALCGACAEQRESQPVHDDVYAAERFSQECLVGVYDSAPDQD